MPPAARVTDMHVCPMVTGLVPHVGGPILPPCSLNVLTGFLPQARITDLCLCVGPVDAIVRGSPTVLVNGLMAARIGDNCVHGGVIVSGCPTVIIGDGTAGGSTAAASAMAIVPPKDGAGGQGPETAKEPEIPDECGYLKKGETVEASKAKFDRIRKPAKLGTAKDIKHKFPGGTEDVDAISQTVEIDGRTITVIRPKDSVDPKHLPTMQQMASALGAVPSKQLDKVQNVVLSNQANPDDAYWEKEYNIPGFSSAATGGPGGLTFYPKSSKWDQAFVDSTAIHEGGHAYSAALWKDAKLRDDWKAATTADKRSPSNYADSDVAEDFSESLVMYSLSKGTPCEAIAEKLFPNRYAALDKLLADEPKK
jgi:uncharacterized Zn-binding protein involved in type VI secretion